MNNEEVKEWYIQDSRYLEGNAILFWGENREYEKPVLLKDLGMRFPTENSKNKKRFGLFKCFCGNEFETLSYTVKNGHTKSCGCLKHRFKLTHGLSKHRLYGTWEKMISRCYNPKNTQYKNYGSRGITVCERWHYIENFVEDMFPTFEEGLSLDRIDVNGDYEPSNCRWATATIQSRNTRLLRGDNTSGFRGVFWHKTNGKWQVKIVVNSKQIYLGHFNTSIEGAMAYNNFVIENDLEHPLNIFENKIKEGL